MRARLRVCVRDRVCTVYVRVCVCVCACVRMRVRACMYVCVATFRNSNKSTQGLHSKPGSLLAWAYGM